MATYRRIALFLAILVACMIMVSKDTRAGWIHNTTILQVLQVSATPMTEVRVLTTIKLGIGPKDKEGFLLKMKNANIKIDKGADQILSNPLFTLTQKECEVDLVVVTPSDLGFSDKASYRKIYKKAKKIGLELCPPDVGPQLQMQYIVEPMGERLIIGMVPLTDPYNCLGVFFVEHDEEGFWLESHWGDKNDLSFWPDNQLVFVRPRKSALPADK